jgi:phosphatidylglycerol---prolipoprotein diacylglyceryl transferase
MLTLYRNVFAAPRDLIPVIVMLWIGLGLSEKRNMRHGISANDLNNLTFFSFFGYLIGGRFLFALANLPAFVQNPVSLLSLNIDLFDPWGGIAVAILIAWSYVYRRKLYHWAILDALTPLFAAFMIGLGLAHLASGNAFGEETSIRWGMELWGAVRHPSQIYEIIAATLTAALIWYRRLDNYPGEIFLTFIAVTSAYRLFLETFRGDSTLILGGLRMEQLLAWITLAVALLLIQIKAGKISTAKER